MEQQRRVSPVVRWSEGKVRECCQHFELRVASHDDECGWDQCVPIARVGPPVDGCVNVQFLVKYNSKHDEAIEAVIGEIEFYLLNKGELDPWRYAQYHCGTQANFYSGVRWGYIVPDLDSAVGDFTHGLRTFPGFARHTFTVGQLCDDPDWRWGFDDGVYCIVSGGRVEYVGRSLGSTLGRRISDQLKAQSDPKWARVVNDRETQVVVFAVDQANRHFASALEAYLIECLDPSFNSKSQ